MTNPMTTKELAALTRYEPEYYGLMLHDPIGDYVKFDDAERTMLALTARVDKYEAALKYIAKTWPDSFAARDARAALNAKDVTP